MKTALLFLSASLCLPLAAQSSSAQTVAVGKCRPQYPSYSTISGAVAAAPSGGTVLVCPGTYPESVTITTPLTLQGLTSESGVRKVYVQSFSVQGAGPVNISNVVVGQGVTSGGGITYSGSSGTVENVDVRSGGVVADPAGNFMCSTLNVRNSSVSSGGIYAGGNVGFCSTVLNLASNWIVSSSPTAFGVFYDYSTLGTATHNIIGGAGQIGLELGNLYCCVTASENTVSGYSIGIYICCQGLGAADTATVTHNSLLDNGIGIFVSDYDGGGETIGSNTIVQSTTAAIDLDCAQGQRMAERNTIVSAPIGIANVPSGDAITGNSFYDVTTATTACPNK
jgi:hypothetical protein